MSALAQAGFRAIAVDMPPFGYSEKLIGSTEYSRKNQAKRIIGIIDSLGIKSVVLVGHSFGARPTIEAALKAPVGQVKQLILIDPALGFQTDPTATSHFEQNNPSIIMRILFSSKFFSKAILSTYGTNPLSTKKLFSSFVSRKEVVTEARVRMLQEPLVLKNTTDAYVDWLNEFMISQDDSETSNFNNLKKLSIPVVLIWGSNDDITPLWQGEALVKLIPDSQLEVIDNVGHIPYIEDVGAFNSLLIKSLKIK
jgi:pimeloyl-ACP methyl ester carboxylesterase